MKYLQQRFDEGTAKPDWQRFDNPGEFYDQQRIIDRQQRWAREDAEEQEEGRPALPECSQEALDAMSVIELIDWLRTHQDRVPRNVIDACARRGPNGRDIDGDTRVGAVMVPRSGYR